MKPKIIFFGSDKYSQIVLNAIKKDGRFRIIRNLKNKPDVGVLASYGKILPSEILAIPKYGILNIHPSLLPKYRGASPVQAVILAGDKETGVSIIKMDERVDHGPIVAQFTEKILPDDTAESLYQRLFTSGAEVLLTILPVYLNGQIESRRQDDSQATYTKKLTREDGFVPPKMLKTAMEGNGASFVSRFIRAMFPYPGAWSLVDLRSTISDDRRLLLKLKRLKILKAHLENGKLVLDLVQLEGKKPVSFKQFQEGYPGTKIVS